MVLTVSARGEQRQITVTENVAYRTDVGPNTVLDMAQPLFGPQQDRPAILLIHGGGWNAGSKDDAVYRSLMIDYAMKGYVVCNMNYRLIREAPMPACIEDVKAAINWMKSNARTLGIDPQRIGTYGHSAGGHLSLMAGLTRRRGRPHRHLADGQAGPASPGPHRRGGLQLHGAGAGHPAPDHEGPDHQEGARHRDGAAAPGEQGAEDPLVRPELTEDWVKKMQQAGASVDYVKVHGNHGVAFDQQLEFTRPAMDAFYARYLKHNDSSISFEQLKVPDFGGSGRSKAVAVREPSLSDFVVYRPLNIRRKLPVLIFCNGGCMDTSIGYENMLTDVASYGYMVVAVGEMQMFAQHENDRPTPSSVVQKALDWVSKQASDPASPYYDKIDAANIAAAGHSCGGAQVLANCGDPRLKTYIILNAGMGKMTMADASAKSLRNLHGPILYLVGGQTDVAWKNAQMDYKAIKKVPVVLADNVNSGHGGTYEQPNGGANSRMVRAWLDWQLKGRDDNEKLFIEGDLKGYDNWTIEHKNFVKKTKK